MAHEGTHSPGSSAPVPPALNGGPTARRGLAEQQRAGAGLDIGADSVPYISGWAGDDALEQLERPPSRSTTSPAASSRTELAGAA